MKPAPHADFQPSAGTAGKADTKGGISAWFSGWRALVPIQLIVLAFWNIDFAFFWKDDWMFMGDLMHMDLSYVMASHHGHVIPLFKVYYYLQFSLLGTSALAFSYIAKFLFAGCGLALLTLALRITSKPAAWALTIIFLIHPIVYEQVEWFFEQCISLHLIFQLLAVLFFLRWTASGQARDLWITVLFTVVQNYFFGNGLFIPLLFVLGILLLRTDGQGRKQGLLTFLVLFVLFMAIQMALGGERASIPRTITGFTDIFAGAFKLFAIDAARWFFVRENLLGRWTPILGMAISFGLLALAFTRRDRNRNLAAFHTLWFLFTFCSVPIALGHRILEREGLPHYYSVICMIPVLFIAEQALGGRPFWKRIPKPALMAGLTFLIGGVFLVDRELVRMVSFRNHRNQQALLRSIETNTPFHAFDDPAIYNPMFDIKIEDPVGAYQYWIPFNRLGSPFGYARDPDNWIMDTSIFEAQEAKSEGEGSSVSP